VQRLLALDRERYLGFNVQHFHHLARRQHGVRFCYAFVEEGPADRGPGGQAPAPGSASRRRDPRACFGELYNNSDSSL